MENYKIACFSAILLEYSIIITITFYKPLDLLLCRRFTFVLDNITHTFVHFSISRIKRIKSPFTACQFLFVRDEGMGHRRVPNIEHEEWPSPCHEQFLCRFTISLAFPSQHLLRSLSLLYLISVKFELHANHHDRLLFMIHA